MVCEVFCIFFYQEFVGVNFVFQRINVVDQVDNFVFIWRKIVYLVFFLQWWYVLQFLGYVGQDVDV